MSFFSEASLAMIPSGYKTSKVYSALPTSGDGDLTFTRSNDTATRVGPDGLIEKVRTNLALQSQTLDNASWDKSDATVTANTTIAPDGTLTADTITAVVIDQRVNQSVTVAASTEYTFSFFAKKGTTVTPRYSVYDLSNNAFILTQVDYSALVNTSTWSRITATFTTPAGCTSISIYPINAATLGTTFIWGCQLEAGVATDYIATTSAAVTVGPVANVPRLDYLDSSSPRLLLEPQRTNLALYSEQFDNAWWTAAGASITANTAVAPDGTTSMDRLTETTATSGHQVVSSSVTIFGGVARVFSAFVKKGNVRYIQLANVAFGDSSASAIFDLDTKTVTDSRASSGSGPTFSIVSASVEDYGNGILRLILVNTSSFDSPTYHIAHSNQATFSGATLVDGIVSYAGNASSYTDIWGAQVEAGAYATSYIPTLGASVTRGADAASKTGISSLIGQTEGTIFWEGKVGFNNSEVYVFLQNTLGDSIVDSIFIQRSGGVSVVFNIYDSSTQVVNISGGTYTIGQTLKIAAAYKLNDVVLYVNGVQIGTDTSAAIPATTSMQLGAYPALSTTELYMADNVKQTLLFTSRLSNDDLATLTTI